MINPYDLLNSVLIAIEQRIKDEINADILADEFSLSSVHLQRLFKFAFDKSIGNYIRSRKLAATIDSLLNTDMDILDIAIDYAFDYEQSYIRSFKREFDITPGNLRKKRQIVKITAPLHLFDSQKVTDGIMFGPDIVMVPGFTVIGRRHRMPFRDDLCLSPALSGHFWDNEKKLIKNSMDPNMSLNISTTAGGDNDYFYHMPAVKVKSLDYVPEGFDVDTFKTSLCARFRFIGKNINELNTHVADEMFAAIDDFMDDEKQKYFLERKRINFERFDLSLSKEGYCMWEWFAPVILKTEKDTAKPSGIDKIYKQNLPALRFIGKKYKEAQNYSGKHILDLMDELHLKKYFDLIEKQTKKELKTFFEGGNAYISLVKKDGGKIIEHWMGMFMPEKTNVPDGYDYFDFPKTIIDVCRVYGKRNEIVDYDRFCRGQLGEDMLKNTQWSFLRFNWHRFFEEDKFGKRLLDYCYFSTIPVNL